MTRTYTGTYDLSNGLRKQITVVGDDKVEKIKVKYLLAEQQPEVCEFRFHNEQPSGMVDSTGFVPYTSFDHVQYSGLFRKARFNGENRDDLGLLAKELPRPIKESLERCLVFTRN